ncbi:MAG: hypothetical protein P8Z49_11695 [Acidobacteriota bacterium]
MLRRILLILFVGLFAALPLNAEFFSKRFDFQQERWIRLDEKAGSMVIEDIKFEFPSFIGPKRLDIRGRNQAVIHVKNYGEEAVRVHLAVALFDARGNLVGCGTTGSKLGSTKPGEEETFFVGFDYVNSKLATAQYYYLTLETEPAR